MATPNYSFEKRRRELDKKAKKEEKRKRKLEEGNAPAAEAADVDETARAADAAELAVEEGGDQEQKPADS